MVPIFSIEAWFSLFFHGAYEYIGIFRELYEAFVLSSFVYYIIELLGGEDELVLKLRRKDASYGEHPIPFKICLGEWTMGRQFMMNCKYGVVSESPSIRNFNLLVISSSQILHSPAPIRPHQNHCNNNNYPASSQGVL